MVKLFRQEEGRKKFLIKSLWKLHVALNLQGKERKEAPVSIRIKIGKGDPAVEAWLAAQKSRSGSVQLLIKAFAYLHGNVDITKLGFDELLGGKVEKPEKAQVREPEKAEEKPEEKRQEIQENRSVAEVGGQKDYSTEKESEEKKEYEEAVPEEKNCSVAEVGRKDYEKKKNMLMSMM